MRIGLTARDDAVPRTVYYDRFLAALHANPRFVADEAQADLLFPAEDTALETNWPRYGDYPSAFVRGKPDLAAFDGYLKRLAGMARRLCVVNLHPFRRLPLALKARTNFIVADGCLAAAERAANPRTISLPALPITVQPGPRGLRPVLASFRGVPSHPCRKAVFALHDGRDFICRIVDQSRHARRIDAIAGIIDQDYANLLARSTFGLVPRGDALFSYRLLEVMAAGAIPVVISDGWVLPFDRTIAWDRIALHVPEREVAAIPALLRALAPDRVLGMQSAVFDIYARHLADLDRIVETLLGEAAFLLAGK